METYKGINDKSMSKKAFILYADLISVVEKLIIKDREENTNNTGELLYHILQYVNDRNPEPNNFTIEMVFEPIRLQLNRDLQKYEIIREKRAEAGKLGGRPRKKQTEAKKANGLFEKQTKAKKPVTVNDTVTVNDIKEKIYKKEVVLKESIQPYIEKYGKEMCSNFFLYWSEPNRLKTKLRYEMQKTWDVSRRLSIWAKNDKSFNGNSNATEKATSIVDI